MSFTDISIIIFILIFTVSGFIINFIRGKQKDIILYSKDTYSLLWFRILVPVGIVLSTLCYFYYSDRSLNDIVLVIIGYILIIVGFIIRWWAVLSLGDAFRAKLSIVRDHQLKTDGIYSIVRHPSYTGLLIYYLGLGVMMQNVCSLIILLVFSAFAVINRIEKEERMLKNYFKQEYMDYCKKTKKLIPYIY